MKISRDQYIERPFVLKAADLQVLEAALAEMAAKPKYEIKCKDSLNRHFSSLDELLAFDNTAARQILSLRLTATTEDRSVYFSLRFENKYFATIHVGLDGDPTAVTAFSETVDARLEAMRPSYWPLARFNFLNAFLAISIVIAILLTVAPSKALTYVSFSGAIAIIGLMTAVGPIVLYGLNALRSAVFPMGVFAIGQGGKRHKDMGTIRTWVLLAFAVGVLASLFVSWIR